jgi:vacuolar-type H+-ATPase subunit F/Vma7
MSESEEVEIEEKVKNLANNFIRDLISLYMLAQKEEFDFEEFKKDIVQGCDAAIVIIHNFYLKNVKDNVKDRDITW